MSASTSTSSAVGIANLKAIKRTSERLGRIALMSSLVGAVGIFFPPFLYGLCFGAALTLCVCGAAFLRIAEACDVAIIRLRMTNRVSQ